MRDRRNGHLGFVGLILAFPPLIAASAGPGMVWEVAAVEAVVASGLAYAAWQRRCLRARRAGVGPLPETVTM